MRVTFLGTGTSQGVPVIGCQCEVCKSLDYRDKRLRVSIHIEVGGLSLVIDSGPDFRQQMLREDINRLDALIFTHEHKDHTAGMDDVRAYNFIQKADMPAYVPTRMIEQLKQEYHYVFGDSDYPGIPKVKIHPVENKPFSIKDVDIAPIEVLHYKLPVFGYRIKDFTYITDVKSISDKELKKVKGTKMLVIGALRKTEHISHLTLAEALDLIEKVQPERAFITHISHYMGLHGDVNLELPDNVQLAFDGLKIQV